VRWGTVLPQDRTRLVSEQITLVNAGLRSRSRALAELGGEDPALERDDGRSLKAMEGGAPGRNVPPR